jgi:SAM-dependent methyltransferase
MTEQVPSADSPQAWGAASRGYADKVAPFLMRAFADAFVERLGAASDAEVLEVGAGSGVLTETLAPRVGSLLATDYAPEMIEVLKERMRALGLENVSVEVMDGQALDLDADRFDAAASSFALMLFPDRARGFSELSRVLRPGRRALVSAWAGPDRFELFGLFLDAMSTAFPDMPPPPSPPPVFSLADPADFKAQMEAGGFRDVEVEYVSEDLEVATVDELWAMLTVGAPPVKVLLDRIGAAGERQLRETLAEIVEDRFGGGPIITTNVATVGVGSSSWRSRPA